MMSDSELLLALDAVHDELTRLGTYRLELLARCEETGQAKALGARDTVELITFRHRLSPQDVRADVKLAQALPKYETVTAALPNLHSTGELRPTVANSPCTYLHLEPGQSNRQRSREFPASANVPVENLIAAEEQLVKASRHLIPPTCAS